ncbi:MAG: SDR family NAD(P)-dependent oxidoreductase [Nocardia sp.]|nr:SDR family NAD(P)-dependent oxidoreductase [Nocardia sp.]
MELEAGQVAVVTGAAHGIGRAVAAALVERGLRVAMADLDTAILAQAAAELGDQVIAVPTDIADLDRVRALADRTLADFGRVDLIVNNAGVSSGGPSWDIAPADWDRVWSVNVGGVVNGIHVFVPHQLYATTHPAMSLAARDRIDTILDSFGAPARQV